MKILTSIAFAILFAAPAFSANVSAPPTTGVPQVITLTPQDVAAMRDYLGKLPYNEAAPLVQFLAMKEAEAQKAAAEKKPK